MNYLLIADDKPKSEVKSRAKRGLDDSKHASNVRKENRGLHTLNTTNKINIVTLSVQKICMNFDLNQTKILSNTTQDSSLKSQINATQKIALIVCLKYDESHFFWRCVHTLMEQHT